MEKIRGRYILVKAELKSSSDNRIKIFATLDEVEEYAGSSNDCKQDLILIDLDEKLMDYWPY